MGDDIRVHAHDNLSGGWSGEPAATPQNSQFTPEMAGSRLSRWGRMMGGQMLVASDTAGTRLAMPCDYWVRRLVTRPTAQSGAHATCHALLRVENSLHTPNAPSASCAADVTACPSREIVTVSKQPVSTSNLPLRQMLMRTIVRSLSTFRTNSKFL